ncbi:O-antigen ligase family protein [Desulfatirhabdium butyrativorans]|uniref:O-antigen ligase family protein n=1 Tax=Desulfatirhabdium butyrativorans TaxID=340467 RepID=UPI00041D700B|nr:O-antigen ligase family protein [Desulfatirhabdium butyrativorans]
MDDSIGKKVSPGLFIGVFVTIGAFMTAFCSVGLNSRDYFFMISGIIFLVLIPLLLANYRYAAYLLIVIFPIENISFIYEISSYKYDTIRISILDIYLLLALLCLFIFKSTNKSDAFSKDVPYPGYGLLLFVSFLFFCAVSIMWAPHLVLSFYHVFRLMMNSVMFWIIVTQLTDGRDLVRAVKIIIATSVVSAIGMLISMLPLWNISETFSISDRFMMEVSFLTYQTKAACFLPNKSGVILLIIGTLLSFGMLSQATERKERHVLFWIILLLIFTAFHTMARAPVLSLFIAVILLFLSLKTFRMHIVKNLAIFILMVLILFGLFAVSHSYVVSIAKSHYQSEPIQSERALRDRLIIWGRALTAMEENNAYWLGLGPGAGTFYENPEAHVHNIVFSIFVDFGFLGFGVFSIILLSSLKSFYAGWWTLRDSLMKALFLSAAAGIVSIAISGMLDYDYNFNLLWYAAAICCAIYRNAIRTPSFRGRDVKMDQSVFFEHPSCQNQIQRRCAG